MIKGFVSVGLCLYGEDCIGSGSGEGNRIPGIKQVERKPEHTLSRQEQEASLGLDGR